MDNNVMDCTCMIMTQNQTRNGWLKLVVHFLSSTLCIFLFYFLSQTQMYFLCIFLPLLLSRSSLPTSLLLLLVFSLFLSNSFSLLLVAETILFQARNPF